MSDKIDNRTVHMGFDNKDFEGGIDKSSKSLSKFDKQLETMDGASGLNSVAGAAMGVSSKFTALGTIATGALLTIGSRAVELGEKLIRSIAVDPIMQGYEEYELKINSIKTMLASGKTAEGLPVTLDMVNEQLAQLNKYSDDTIYSFADMTQNIGKFTNAGVDLETSVQAIKGIANAAALSGANSNEASRAMYNFAQALSAGHVKLIDWKSIENANMATVEFKQQLLDAAVAAGTVEKSADGMYTVLTTNNQGKTMEMAIDATKNFNDSLQYQWMTTEVLTDTLGDYADATTEIGAKATEAATKVRTWSQLMDTTKEAVGSGWATTFEIIFGDFDEATDLYTGLSTVMGDMVGATSDARNKILSDWDKLGGRLAILEAIKTIWRNITLIVTEAQRAFRTVFPPMTGKKLAALSKSLLKFVKNIRLTEDVLVKLRNIFKGLFSLISLGWDGLKFIFDVIVIAFKEILSFLPEGGKFLDFSVQIAQFFTNLKNTSDKSKFFATNLEKVRVAIKDFGDKIREVVATLQSKGGAEGFKKAIDTITSVFEGFKLPSSSSGSGGFAVYMKKLTDLFEKIRPTFVEAGKFISTTFGKIKEALGGVWQMPSLETTTDLLMKFFNLLLTGGLWLTVKKLIDSFTDIADSASGMLAGVTGVLDGVKGSLKAYQTQLKADALLKIAGAVALLTVSLIALALIDSDKLNKATLAITALFANLAGSIILMEKASARGLSILALDLIGLASAILLMTGSVAILAAIDPAGLKRGLAGLAAIMAGVVAFVKALSSISGAKLLAAAAGMNLFAVAILALSGVVAIFGQFDSEKLKQGLTAMGVVLAEIAAFAVIVSGTVSNADLVAAGSSLLFMGYALSDMASTISMLGDINTGSLVQGLAGVAASLSIMVIAMRALAAPNVLLGAAAMAVMATSIAIFTPAIKALGEIPLENLAVGLLALVGIFTVVGVAGAVLGPIAPAIVAVAGSIALLAVSVAAIGVGVGIAAFGIAAFITALISLSAIGAAGISVIVAGVAGLAMLIPMVLTKIAEGIIALARVIGEGAPVIAEAIVSIMTNLAFLIAQEFPKFIVIVLDFILELQRQILERVPEFVSTGLKITLAFLEGVEENIGPITEALVGIITNFLNAIAERLPEFIKAGANMMQAYMEGLGEAVPQLIDAGFKMVVDFINGLADAIRENTPLMVEALTNLGSAMLEALYATFGLANGASSKATDIAKAIGQGFLNGIRDMSLALVGAMNDLAQSMIDGVTQTLGIRSPSTVMNEVGVNVVQGLINGMRSLSNKVLISASKTANDIMQPFKDSVRDYIEVGRDMAEGIIDGIDSMVSEVVSSVQSLADDALEGIKDFLSIASPSKKFFEIGKNVAVGMAKGIVNHTADVVNGVKGLGGSALDSMSTTMGKINDALNADLDMMPVITPVLDLSNVKTGAGTLSNMLSNNPTYGLAQSASYSSKALESAQNGSDKKEVVSTKTEIENTFDIREMIVRTDADIKAIAEKLKGLQDKAVRGRGLKTVPAY